MKTYFTVGPAILTPKIQTYMNEFLQKQYGSISHRGSEFKRIYQHTDEQLRLLLGINSDAAIMFLGSASEVWEKIIISLVEHESFHLVNGSFSSKFYEYAKMLKRHALSFEKPIGQGFKYGEIEVPEFAELIAITQNETSTGVQMREQDIQKLKRSNSSKIVAVDMVSSVPNPQLDLNLIDTAFFSIQKSFGLPAGLGVWIANPSCYEKSIILNSKPDYNMGAHNNLLSLWDLSKNFQTPCTPNVLGIFLLGKVAEDMNLMGIENIRKQTDKKAKLMYSFFEKHPSFNVATEDEELRSKTVIVVNCLNENSAEVIDKLSAANFIVGAGYGKEKARQIRISNFVYNTEEQVEELLSNFEKMF